jgi:tripartite-type tricarboxylate transporter receptor subunit TctC
MQFPRRSTTAVTIALVALTWLAAADARAQDFPSRIIRVVVAFPAGGPTDFVARILADKLKPLLGQNVIVENRPGANGAIGADYVAKGEADGHLLFLTTVGAVPPSWWSGPTRRSIPPRSWPRLPGTSRERFHLPRPARAA